MCAKQFPVDDPFAFGDVWKLFSISFTYKLLGCANNIWDVCCFVFVLLLLCLLLLLLLLCICYTVTALLLTLLLLTLLITAVVLFIVFFTVVHSRNWWPKLLKGLVSWPAPVLLQVGLAQASKPRGLLQVTKPGIDLSKQGNSLRARSSVEG